MVSGPPPEDESREDHKARWRREIEHEHWRWRNFDGCPLCGEWIGHWAGGVKDGPPPCPAIPMNIPLEEVRPNCVVVRRHWIGDAIRAACGKGGH